MAKEVTMREALQTAQAFMTCCMATGCYSHEEIVEMARATKPTIEEALSQPPASTEVLREALDRLERAASAVHRKGAATGPQWSRLSGELIRARQALTAWNRRAPTARSAESADGGVIQDDRDAAAKLLALPSFEWAKIVRDEIRGKMHDDYAIVQAFRDHRLAALTASHTKQGEEVERQRTMTTACIRDHREKVWGMKKL